MTVLAPELRPGTWEILVASSITAAGKRLPSSVRIAASAVRAATYSVASDAAVTAAVVAGCSTSTGWSSC